MKMKVLKRASEASTEELMKLWDEVHNFITKMNINCEETIFQSDSVIINAYEFIYDLCEIVGYGEYDSAFER